MVKDAQSIRVICKVREFRRENSGGDQRGEVDRGDMSGGRGEREVYTDGFCDGGRVLAGVFWKGLGDGVGGNLRGY